MATTILVLAALLGMLQGPPRAPDKSDATVCPLMLRHVCLDGHELRVVYLYSHDGRTAIALPVCCPDGG